MAMMRQQMLESIVQVIEACAISPIKVESLANFELEYIFFQLRAESVNQVVDLSYAVEIKFLFLKKRSPLVKAKTGADVS